MMGLSLIAALLALVSPTHAQSTGGHPNWWRDLGMAWHLADANATGAGLTEARATMERLARTDPNEFLPPNLARHVIRCQAGRAAYRRHGWSAIGAAAADARYFFENCGPHSPFVGVLRSIIFIPTAQLPQAQMTSDARVVRDCGGTHLQVSTAGTTQEVNERLRGVFANSYRAIQQQLLGPYISGSHQLVSICSISARRSAHLSDARILTITPTEGWQPSDDHIPRAYRTQCRVGARSRPQALEALPALSETQRRRRYCDASVLIGQTLERRLRACVGQYDPNTWSIDESTATPDCVRANAAEIEAYREREQYRSPDEAGQSADIHYCANLYSGDQAVRLSLLLSEASPRLYVGTGSRRDREVAEEAARWCAMASNFCSCRSSTMALELSNFMVSTGVLSRSLSRQLQQTARSVRDSYGSSDPTAFERACPAPYGNLFERTADDGPGAMGSFTEPGWGADYDAQSLDVENTSLSGLGSHLMGSSIPCPGENSCSINLTY